MKTINGIQVLEKHDIERDCPSFYNTHPISRVSERYHHVNTREIALQLWSHGWMPTLARERAVRNPQRRGYTHHVVRWAHRDLKTRDGDYIEIVGTNSHDTSSAFHLQAGIFRLVCENGLIVATSDFGEISIRHVGDIGHQIRTAVDQIGAHAGQVAGKVDAMQAVTLTPRERYTFAIAASRHLYGDGHVPITPAQLLQPRRSADTGYSLWTTYNVVQENATRGGLRGIGETGRRLRTRAVRSINRDIQLNRSLWALAEEHLVA
jgi:hypothetical protein